MRVYTLSSGIHWTKEESSGPESQGDLLKATQLAGDGADRPARDPSFPTMCVILELALNRESLGRFSHSSRCVLSLFQIH